MATLLVIESWLQSTGRALPSVIQERGLEFVLVTRDPELYAGHPARALAADVVVTETNDLAMLGAAVQQYHSRTPVSGVLTTCDYYLEAAAHCAEVLGLPGPLPDVMRLATRKDRVREMTSRTGLRSPRFAVAKTWETCLAEAERVGYPCIVKPVDLNSSTSVHLVEDEVALKDAFGNVTDTASNTRGQARCRRVLIEEYLEGPEVSVEAVTLDGRTHVLGVTDKVVDPVTFVECGHRFPARLDDGDQQAVETLTRDALAAIGFTHGVSHTEVKLTAQGPRLVEINPRQGGGYIFELVSLVTGVNPLGLLVDLALGARPRIDGHGAAESAAVSFVLPRVDGARMRIDAAALEADPFVQRWDVSPAAQPGRARDNNDRLGYVITVGAAGVDPLRHAQALTFRAPHRY